MLLVVVALAFVYAMPNLYPPDPAIQVSGASGQTAITEQALDRITAALDQAGIDSFGAEIAESGTSALVRLRSSEDQLAAKEAVQKAMSQNEFLVALNLAPTTPAFLRSLNASPMNLGLDLSGGVHFLLEVDVDVAVDIQLESISGQVKDVLLENSVRYIRPKIESGVLSMGFRSDEDRSRAMTLIRDINPDLQISTVDTNTTANIEIRFSEFAISEIHGNAVTQNLVALKNRVNELGVSEPLVQRQGVNRIVVELPGVQDTTAAKRVIGKTANLEFRLEHDPRSDELSEEFPFYSRDVGIGSARLESKVIVTGESVTDAGTGFDENGQPQVSITLSSDGGNKMNAATYKNVGRRMGALFVEYKTRYLGVDADGDGDEDTENYYEKKIINLATVQSALGVNFRITGVGSQYEAQELALLLRAGALAAPMEYVEERTVGPSLGAANIAAGVLSIQIGLLLVVIFMFVYYRLFGVIANLSLAANLVMLTAAMSILGATLTLPGIAGIVLTLGMAVDANVLIFSRIREEIKNGLSIQGAINAGYERAWSTIFDANLTTLIVAAILWLIGSGPVQGFAVTLFIGILTSMFTAVFGSRALVNLFFGSRKNLKKLWI